MKGRFAGSDTTAIGLRAIFYYLAKNPGPYQKLREEIDRAEKEGKFSDYVKFEEGMNLPYL